MAGRRQDPNAGLTDGKMKLKAQLSLLENLNMKRRKLKHVALTRKAGETKKQNCKQRTRMLPETQRRKHSMVRVQCDKEQRKTQGL